MAQKYEEYQGPYDGFRWVDNVKWWAQTFTVGAEGHTITSLKLYCRRSVGGTPGTVTVSIRNTDGVGHPSGGDLTSGTANGNGWPETLAWREIAVTEYELNPNTKYAIVFRATSCCADWGRKHPGVYPNGNAEVSSNSGASWGTEDDDFMFEVWGNPLVEVIEGYRVEKMDFKADGFKAEGLDFQETKFMSIIDLVFSSFR